MMEAEPEEIRFGVIAVQKGFVTPEKVVKALEIQVKEDLSKGEHRRIGKILLEQKQIKRSQLDEVLQSLKQI